MLPFNSFLQDTRMFWHVSIKCVYSFCEFFLFPNSVSHLISVHFCVLWSICPESCCLETILEEHSPLWTLGDLRLLMRSWQKSLACSPSTDIYFKVTINICLGITHSRGHKSKSIGCKVRKKKKPWENSKFYKSMPKAGGTKKLNLHFFFKENFSGPQLLFIHFNFQNYSKRL